MGVWSVAKVARSYVKVNPHNPEINAICLLLLLLSLITTCRRLYVLWKPEEMQFWFWFTTPAITAIVYYWVRYIEEGKKYNNGRY